MTLRERLLRTDAPGATVFLRIAVAAVFASEGIQKFLFPETLGVGRFAKIGIPWPESSAPFVGAVEIACGLLVGFGLLTRAAAILLIIDMVVAIATTKVPILLKSGLWAMAHEARTDWAMLLICCFLVVAGGGTSSIDERWAHRVAANARNT